jgi:hypothetical protein
MGHKIPADNDIFEIRKVRIHGADRYRTLTVTFRNILYLPLCAGELTPGPEEESAVALGEHIATVAHVLPAKAGIH